MPTICTFSGIVIQMFWQEHGAPHFHALYAEFAALIDLQELRVLRGSLPRRALTLVMEWAADHRQELVEDREPCRELKHPRPIEPLR